jgi:asparagine synthase (glutamine-hydrolysing)
MRYPEKAMQQHYIERVVDLTEPDANQIHGLSIEEVREIVLRQPADAVGHIAGSFAVVAREGKTVKMARSLDRPMRYFLAKRQEGPVLIVAPRIDLIFQWSNFNSSAAPILILCIPGSLLLRWGC